MGFSILITHQMVKFVTSLRERVKRDLFPAYYEFN